MTQLTKNCELVITDSGGLQKESYFFEKKCLVLRNTTEWVELIDNGYAMLGGCEKGKILAKYQHLIGKDVNWKTQLYGNGKSANEIVKGIKK
jgi:UDP-GlcNAc3NAcA epimerase